MLANKFTRPRTVSIRHVSKMAVIGRSVFLEPNRGGTASDAMRSALVDWARPRSERETKDEYFAARFQQSQYGKGRCDAESQWPAHVNGWVAGADGQALVDWDEDQYGGIGVYATEDIAAGSVLREGTFGQNMVRFHDFDDVKAFCMAADGKPDLVLIKYLSCYMFGVESDDRAAFANALWVLGCALNHSNDPGEVNTIFHHK